MRKEVPPCRAALLYYSLFIFRSQGNDLPACPKCAPHFFFSLLEKKKRAAPGAKEKEGLGCRRRWTRAPTRWPCAEWQAWHKFGANLNGLFFSFRCRSPGACRRAVYTGLFERSHGENLKGHCKHPASERAVGDAGASQVCTKRLNSCRLAKEHLSEHGTGYVCTPALFFSSTVHGAPLLLRTEKKRRGVHLGQAGKSLPCCRKK